MAINSGSNPAVKKLGSFSSSVFGENNVATYKGIGAKIGYFMALILAGLVSYFAVLGSTSLTVASSLACVAMLVGVVSSLIAAFAPNTCSVTGSIYAFAEGYVLTWLSSLVNQAYQGIVVLALGLTAIIVAVMGILYSKGIVTANEKLRAVCMTALIASIIGGLLYLFVVLIAPNSGLANALTSLNNGPLGLLLAVGGVFLAAFLLVFDFDAIARTVEYGLDKKYEWYAAYGMVVGVIYVYVKVLNLLIRIFGSSRN